MLQPLIQGVKVAAASVSPPAALQLPRHHAGSAPRLPVMSWGYPPTPAASRGSALEEALLATRGEKRNFARPVLRALLFGCGGGAV